MYLAQQPSTVYRTGFDIRLALFDVVISTFHHERPKIKIVYNSRQGRCCGACNIIRNYATKMSLTYCALFVCGSFLAMRLLNLCVI